MKVTIVHQYFKHPREGGAVRSYYLAKGLVGAGHEVEIITAHNAPITQIKRIEGIKVFYLPIYYSNELSKYKRIWAFLKFIFLALRVLHRIDRPQLLYVISTPLTVGAIALWVKLTRGVRYIFEIGDLWPEAPIQLGYIRNPLLKKILYRFERFVYQHAYKIVAMSDDIERHIQQGNKVLMIPNMADCGFFHFQDKDPDILSSLGLTNEFVIAYLGTAGRANHLDYLIDAANQLQERELHVKLLIAAEGSELEHFRAAVFENELNNIIFCPYTNKEGVRDLLNVSDAAYISFANVPILSSGSPNKFFDGLAAGKLIIANFEGWVKKEIETAECGFSYAPTNPKELVEKLLPYINSPKKLLQAKQNARTLAEQKFSRTGLIQRWLPLFE